MRIVAIHFHLTETFSIRLIYWEKIFDAMRHVCL